MSLTSFLKRAAAASVLPFLSLAAADAVADPGSPDCSRYRLYGLIPGMSPRDVRDTMGERGNVGGDKRSVEYSRTAADVHVEYDDEVNRRSASLVLVRAHIPISIDTAPVLRSLRERLGAPTTGKDNFADDLRSGPSTWVSEPCGIVVRASREGEHLWDPTRAGIYVEAQVLSRVADAVAPGRDAEDTVVEEMLVTPVVAAQTTAAAAIAPAAIEPVSSPANVPSASRPDAIEVPSPSDSPSLDIAIAGADGVSYPERIARFYVKPVYPAAARFARMSGTVHLRVIVRENGSVARTEVVRVSSPDAGFEESAIEAVKRWRYRPAMRDGKPVTASILVKIEFL